MDSASVRSSSTVTACPSGRADDATVDGVRGSKGKFALKAGVEGDLEFAGTVGLVPAEFDPGTFGGELGFPVMNALGRDIAGDAVDDKHCLGVANFVGSRDFGGEREIGRVLVANVFDGLVVTEKALLEGRDQFRLAG